jgi:hypothetical protein
VRSSDAHAERIRESRWLRVREPPRSFEVAIDRRASPLLVVRVGPVARQPVRHSSELGAPASSGPKGRGAAPMRRRSRGVSLLECLVLVRSSSSSSSTLRGRAGT